MESEIINKLSRKAWAVAVVSALLFALGVVATGAQEFWVWIPQRLASIVVLLGLGGSVVALVQVARVLFSGADLGRRQHWTLLGTIVLAGLPPLVFIGWVIWMRIAMEQKM